MTSELIFRYPTSIYGKRLWSSLKFTFVFYIVLSILLIINDPGLMVWSFISILFFINFFRGIHWIRFQIMEMTVADCNLVLSYLDYNEKKAVIIPLSKLKISKGSTIQDVPDIYIKIVNDDQYVASFYSNNHEGATPTNFKDIYNWLHQKQKACS